MLITSPTYMQTRMLEMALASLMLIVGMTLVWPGDTFGSPIYAVLKAWISETAGGTLLLAIGTLRWAALIINGRLRATPIARIAACMIGSGFWFTFTVAMMAAERSADLGPPVLLAISVWASTCEAYSGFRCGTDAEALDSLGLRQARSKVGRSNGV